MLNLTWEAPFWVFVGLSVGRIFLAPYWRDNEREQEIKTLKDLHQQTESTLRQQIATLTDQLNGRTIRRKQRETLAHFYDRGRKMFSTYRLPERTPDTPWRDWVNEVSAYLDNSLDHSYVIRWEHHAGLTLPDPPKSDIPQRNQKISRDIYFRLMRLREFLKELRD